MIMVPGGHHQVMACDLEPPGQHGRVGAGQLLARSTDSVAKIAIPRSALIRLVEHGPVGDHLARLTQRRVEGQVLTLDPVGGLVVVAAAGGQAGAAG